MATAMGPRRRLAGVVPYPCVEGAGPSPFPVKLDSSRSRIPLVNAWVCG
uniref:Uncharacterized protein n=1 Tax=Arundo donax TaxID=35708 RepID=A0A0A8YNB1_ARUDO